MYDYDVTTYVWWHRSQGGGAFWRSGLQRLEGCTIHRSFYFCFEDSELGEEDGTRTLTERQAELSPRNWSGCHSSSWSTSVARWAQRYSRQRNKIFLSAFWSAELRRAVGRSVCQPSCCLGTTSNSCPSSTTDNNIVQATDDGPGR